MATIKISLDTLKDQVLVSFEYDVTLNSAIKAIPGCHWDFEKKSWSLPYSEENVQRVKELFVGASLEVDLRLDINSGRRNKISEVTRRDIIDYLISFSQPYYGRLELTEFLLRTWDLSKMPSTDGRFSTAAGDIYQHMVNNEDWTDEFLLFTYLDLKNCDEAIFLKFLENCLHPIVVGSKHESEELVSAINQYLQIDGYKLEVSAHLSNRPVYKAVHLAQKRSHKPYAVALSFAGENRNYVESVAEFLRERSIKVFYDKYEEVDMWGKELTEHLEKIYRDSAEYCIMFVSKHYADKLWPTHERRSAMENALRNKEEYVLPVRFDNTVVPGLRSTIAYIDLNQKTPEQLGAIIIEKLKMRG